MALCELNIYFPSPLPPALTLFYIPTLPSTVVMDEPMTQSEFLESIHNNVQDVFAGMCGTPDEARACVEAYPDMVGLISFFFSGSAIDLATANGECTFFVGPGVWAASVIAKIDDEAIKIKGPFVEVDEVDRPKYLSGGYGVVFEAPFIKGYALLKRVSNTRTLEGSPLEGSPFRLLRFVT